MSFEVLAISILWALVFVYAMAGSIDFGAGFWAMVYMKEKDAKAAAIADRYLSPLWEVTNVFLVLFAVALVGLFPNAAFVYGNLLLIPGSLILILLTIRTVMMVYVHVVDRYRKWLRIISGITGILIPALLVTVFPLSEGGLAVISAGNWTLSISSLLSSMSVYSFILLGLTSELFISAVFLADFSRIGNDQSAFVHYRKNAVWLGAISILCALLVPLTVPQSAAWMKIALQSQSTWFIVSFGFFILGMYFLLSAHSSRMRRVRYAAICITAQYGFAMFAYGKAHFPYLFYPTLTVHNSFTDPVMFKNALIVLIIGIAILFPGFIWFWRLFLSKRAFFSSD